MSAVALCASADNYVFRHYTVDDGLAHNGVRAICQDRYGFMWFGLDNGLCRYDGVRMNSYRHNLTSADQYVSALFPSDSCLWIGSSRGLAYMRFNDERFVPFTLKTPRGTRISSIVLSITTDHDGRLWLSTQGQGVFCYDRKGPVKLRQFPFKETDGYVNQVLVARNGDVWAVSRYGRSVIFCLKRGGKVFRHYYPTCPYSLDYEVSTMLLDSKGCKWLGTRNNGLLCILPDGTCRSWLNEGAGVVKNIHSILEVRPESMLVGSDDGLVSLDTRTGRTTRYTAQVGRPGSLSDRFIYPLVRDREGGIWIGTFYGGVNYAAPNSGQFECFAHTAGSNSIGGNIINRFAEDGSGRIWISSDDGGLASLEPSTGRITRHSVGQGKDGPGNVHGLWAEGQSLWVGTYTDGIYLINTATGAKRRYAAYTNRRPVSDAMSSYSLLRDSRGRLWNGSLESVSRYDSQADCFVFVKRLGALVLDIDEDRQGRLWFATQGAGLFRLDIKAGRWRHFTYNKKKGSLPDNNINCVLIDSRGRVIVATMSGLCMYDPANDSFKPFGPELDGLEVAAIAEDRQTYWITTTNGLFRYYPGKPLRRFNKSDGLQSNQFFPNAILRASDGRIYVGTNFGFNSFMPSHLSANRTVPTVAITGLEVMNRTVKTGSPELPMAINHISQLDLTYNDNVFTLLFAAQSYCMPGKNQYAYRLDGFDRDWNYVGSITRATYTNLSPGTYTFRVKATNNDGVWSNHEAVLKIVVHPPFWLSVPMKFLYFVLIVAAAVLAVRMLLLRAKRRHEEEMERLREEKERETRDAKIGFFTMIAHEIRTPVSLIIGPLENILKNNGLMPKAVSDDLNVIDRNAHRLLYLVNQLLDFRKVEQKSLVTHFTLCNVAHIVRSVGERFKPTFDQKGIAFDTVCTDESLSAVVDSEAITKVISNLLTNAVKYGHSRVTMKLDKGNNGHSFRITVSDDGQGVRPEDRKRIFRPFYQAVDNKPGTGIGLSIVKNIVDRHHGAVSVESQPGRDTVFTVEIPLDHAGTVVGEGSTDTTPEIITDAETNETEAQPSRSVIPPADGSQQQSILVVEDNKDLLNFISNNLSREYNVLTAENGSDALELLEKHPEVCLVLSDWMMPRMDGDELCRRIRENRMTSHLPFILLTAKTDDGSKIEGLRCGADSYIEKPFSMQYVEERIRNLINMRNMLRERFSTKPLVPLKTIAPTAVDDDFLERMQQIIEEEFSNPELSVNYLANRMAISRSGLFSKIKSLSGVTPNELITIVRLKRAAQLLRENKHQINEICYMVGFGNPSYFAKCFKRQFGITPMEFVAGGDTSVDDETTSTGAAE